MHVLIKSSNSTKLPDLILTQVRMEWQIEQGKKVWWCKIVNSFKYEQKDFELSTKFDL